MDCEKLIGIVREYKYLYDLNDKMYNNIDKKEGAWKENGNKLNSSGQECKKVWNSLRDGFRRAMKRQKETKSGQEYIPQKKWKYEDELSFLKPYLKERSTLTSVKLSHDEIEEHGHADIDHTYADNISEPKSTSKTTNLSTTTVSARRVGKTRKILKFPPRSVSHETPSAVIMKYLLGQKQNDDIDSFFSGMATTVKTFPPHQRAIAKAQVFSVISNLELSIHNSSSPAPTQTPIFSPISSYSSDSSKQMTTVGHCYESDIQNSERISQTMVAQDQSIFEEENSDNIQNFYNSFAGE